MGANSSKIDTDTIHWANVETNNMSSVLPKYNNLSKDASQLVASLNLPQNVTESPYTSEPMNTLMNKIIINNKQPIYPSINTLIKQNNILPPTDYTSETSPFISSEMYNYLINTKQLNDLSNTTSDNRFNNLYQKGGRAKKNPQYKSYNEDDSSSTTSTSSSSSSLSKNDDLNLLDEPIHRKEHEIKHKKDHKKDQKKEHKNEYKKNHKQTNQQKKHKEISDVSTPLSMDDLSYLSSSSHENRNKNNKLKNKSNKNQLNDTSSVSNEHSDTVSISVRTSNINMISDY